MRGIVIINMQKAVFNQKKEGCITYIGNEHCDRLIDFKEVEATIVLPPLGEDKIDELKINYDKIKNNEVVVNDWGALYLLQSLNHDKIVIGRWLSRKILPEIISADDILGFDGMRFEIDLLSLKKVLAHATLLKGLTFSYYHPYVPVTITRRCSSQKRYYSECDGCKKKVVFNKGCDKKFLLFGNMLMIKARLPEIKSRLVDRLVFNGSML